ncbi:MAG: hypothetical protein ACPGXX_12920, partial [Planctomycetaceae bacterium]
EGRPGVIVVEATGIRDIPSGPLLRIGDDRYVPGLKKLADVVHPYPTHADAVRRIGDQYLRTRLTPFNARLLQRWLNWRFPLPMKK